MDNATVAFCILINQRQRNKAIGIETDTQFLRGMAAYIRSSSEKQAKSDVEQVVKASYLKVLIEEHQRLAQRLTDYIMANLEDDDIRNEGVYVMTKLEAYVTHLGDELEALWQPS
ncbi:MAG: hypothetical protein ACYTFW_06600 [Planctomycetota bacterium]|jgi:predicted Ser/Thr protein kinase